MGQDCGRGARRRRGKCGQPGGDGRYCRCPAERGTRWGVDLSRRPALRRGCRPLPRRRDLPDMADVSRRRGFTQPALVSGGRLSFSGERIPCCHGTAVPKDPAPHPESLCNKNEVPLQNPRNRAQASAQEDHVVPTRLIAGVAGKRPAWRGPNEQETHRRDSRSPGYPVRPAVRRYPGGTRRFVLHVVVLRGDVFRV